MPVDQLRNLRTGSTHAPLEATTVDNLLTLFMDRQTTRMKNRLHIEKMNAAGKSEGKMIVEPKRQNLSQSRYVRITDDVKDFRAFSRTQTWDKTEETAARIVLDYRQFVEERFTKGEIGPNTVNEAVKLLRQFCGWCEKTHHLAWIPRDKGLFAKLDYNKSAKSIPQEILYNIYDQADDLEKMWIVLGLNCGFYSMDLSDLTDDMILPGLLNFTRGKTGVNVVYKLWPETERQSKRFLPIIKTGGPIFLTYNFTPLNHFRPSRKVEGKLVKVDNVANRWYKLVKERFGITGYSWANIRDTATTRVESIDPLISDLFIAHQGYCQAACYIDGKMIDHSRLDKVIDQLEVSFAGLWDMNARLHLSTLAT